MATKLSSVGTLYSFCFIFFIVSVSDITAAAAPLSPADVRNFYNVYREAQLLGPYRLRLEKVFGSKSEAKRHLIYSYRNFNAFAAKLTDEERDRLSKLEEVAAVYRGRTYHPLGHGLTPTREVLP